MKILINILLCIICLSAQGQDIDISLNPFYAQFKQDCAQYGIELDTSNLKALKFPNYLEDSIFAFDKVSNVGDKWAGVTIKNIATNERYIFINPRIWYLNAELLKEIIIYHEFFHCFFDLPHYQDNIIMKSFHTNSDIIIYKAHKDKIINELFKRIKK